LSKPSGRLPFRAHLLRLSRRGRRRRTSRKPQTSSSPSEGARGRTQTQSMMQTQPLPTCDEYDPLDAHLDELEEPGANFLQGTAAV